MDQKCNKVTGISQWKAEEGQKCTIYMAANAARSCGSVDPHSVRASGSALAEEEGLPTSEGRRFRRLQRLAT